MSKHDTIPKESCCRKDYMRFNLESSRHSLESSRQNLEKSRRRQELRDEIAKAEALFTQDKDMIPAMANIIRRHIKDLRSELAELTGDPEDLYEDWSQIENYRLARQAETRAQHEAARAHQEKIHAIRQGTYDGPYSDEDWIEAHESGEFRENQWPQTRQNLKDVFSPLLDDDDQEQPEPVAAPANQPPRRRSSTILRQILGRDKQIPDAITPSNTDEDELEHQRNMEELDKIFS